MNHMRLLYPLPLLCRVLSVSRSGYYAWCRRPPSRRIQEDARLAIEVKAAHRRTRESYGPERLQKDLADHGVRLGIHRIKRLRWDLFLRCRQKRKFKATTNSAHSLPVADNLLDQNFVATAPNQVWLTDITYIQTGEGWLYLAGHKDMCTGEIVGYAMSSRMTKNLVSQSLFQAVTLKRPPAGLKTGGVNIAPMNTVSCWYNSRCDHLWAAKETVMIMPQWKVSGESWKPNLYSINVIKPDKRRSKRLQNTLKFSIIVRESKRDLAIFLQQLLNAVFI